MDRYWWADNSQKFAAWLVDNGAEILLPTNPWEVLRFRLDKATHVVYTNAKGKITMQPPTLKLAHKFDAKAVLRRVVEPVVIRPPAPTPAERMAPVPRIVGWARNIVRRGKGLKSLLLSATTGPERVPHCGCDALPWESCKHSKETI